MEYRAKTRSEDGTIKYLLDVPAQTGSLSVESAFIHLQGRADKKPEYILCLSSQVGCAYNCRICANMLRTFYRCLTPREINEQISLVLGQDDNLKKIIRAGSVEHAFMAIGEPLYGTNVIEAIKRHSPLIKDTRFALSTVGEKGTIARLRKARLPFPVRLELSLHFPNDTLRNEWMQSNQLAITKKPVLDIESMLQEASEYIEEYPQRAAVNYALIDGINNTPKCLEELENLFRSRAGFYIKVMRPNRTSSYVASWKHELRVEKTYSPYQFRAELLERGIPATLFESRGKDILAGCGMMAARFTDLRGEFKTPKIPQAEALNIGF